MFDHPLFVAVQDFPPLSKFRCRSEVDWLDISITTKNATNFQTIQNAVQAILGADKKTWVNPMDKGEGGAARIFVIRLHDPSSFAWLTDLFAELERRFPLSSPPYVVTMEIAVDFYSRSTDRSDLEAMTTRLMRETANNGINPRQYGRLGGTGRLHTRFLGVKGEVTKAGDTYYAGTKDTDPVFWRIYLKETDNNKKRIPEVALHRARMEVTLRGIGLAPYATTLTSLGSIRFEELATKFKCRSFVPPKPDESLQPVQLLLADRKCKHFIKTWQAGQHVLDVPKRRKFSKYSRADVALSTLVRGSLRSLTQRFRAEKRGELKPKTRISRGTSSSALITNISTIPPKGGSFSHPPTPL